MNEINKEQSSKNSVITDKQRNYNEIIEFLDNNWYIWQANPTLERIKKLDQAFGNPSSTLNSILVAGSNGKSLTINLTAKLLKEEGLSVGAFYSPHLLTYNERIAINNEAISNKVFTDLANEVIATAQKLNMESIDSYEVLTMMAILHFSKNKLDASIFEVHEGGKFNPVNILNAKAVAVTRITGNENTSEEKLKSMITNVMGIVKNGTSIASGDQSKSNLQLMQNITQEAGGQWMMPIRKLVVLQYPFEQLHGRCAALAERLAQMFVEKYVTVNSTIVNDSLLTKKQGQRGRPTLEAKKHSELNPKRTLDAFWKEHGTTDILAGRFELLDKEKPSVLLDNANNVDAFKNLLLGVRLLHYKRALKGLAIIIGASKDSLCNEEFLRLVRYFFKKTSGQLIICPIEPVIAGVHEEKSWDVEQVSNELKAMKIKARTCINFEEAFDVAKKSIDERHGLIVVTGSTSIINLYWKHKGIKKF